MKNELKPIDTALLDAIVEKNRPKLIETWMENGIAVKVYEAKSAANITTVAYGRVRGLHYD